MFLWSLNMSENAPGERLTNEYNGSLCGRYSQSLANNPPISLPMIPFPVVLAYHDDDFTSLARDIRQEGFRVVHAGNRADQRRDADDGLDYLFHLCVVFWLQSYAKLLKTSNSKRSEYSRFVDAIY